MASPAPATTKAVNNIETDWQCAHKTVLSRNKHLWTSKIFSDCTFLVGLDVANQKVISGHKMILAAASPVFEAMFYGNFENKMPIAISDIEADLFRMLLEYIYLEKVPKFALIADACNLYSAANKYCLPHLKDQCKEYILKNINAQNVCQAFEFAQLFDLSVISDKCKEVMIAQTDQILSSPSFVEILPKTLLAIFDLNATNTTSEMSFFRAFTKYINKNDYDITKLKNESIVEGCKLTTEEMDILRAFGKIRFLTLDPREFCQCIAEANFISNDLALPILMNLLIPDVLPIPKGFCTERIKRLLPIKESADPDKHNETTRYVVNNPHEFIINAKGEYVRKGATCYVVNKWPIRCPGCSYRFKEYDL